MKDSKATINDMNKEVQKGYGGFWGDLGKRGGAAVMGIGNAVISTVALGVDIADFSADAQIAMIPYAGLTETGREAQARMSQAVDTAASLADAGVQLAAMTSEERSGAVDALLTAAVKGAGDSLNKTFIEGDLNYTAEFSGKMVEMVADVATGGAGSLGKMSVKQVVKQTTNAAKMGLKKTGAAVKSSSLKLLNLKKRPKASKSGGTLSGKTNFYVKPDGETLDTKIYNRNSGFRKGVRDETWSEAVEESTGRVRDPLTGRFLSKEKPWDMGHRPKMEFKKERKNAIEKWLNEDENITRKEYLDKLNDPSRYRPEAPSSKRGHRGEDATDDFWE